MSWYGDFKKSFAPMPDDLTKVSDDELAAAGRRAQRREEWGTVLSFCVMIALPVLGATFGLLGCAALGVAAGVKMGVVLGALAGSGGGAIIASNAIERSVYGESLSTFAEGTRRLEILAQQQEQEAADAARASRKKSRRDPAADAELAKQKAIEEFSAAARNGAAGKVRVMAPLQLKKNAAAPGSNSLLSS